MSPAAYGNTVLLRYAIRLRNGAEIISNFADETADSIIIGDGTLAQSLEQWLIGLNAHERHVFLLDPWQAFGSRDDTLVQRIAPEDIPADLSLEVGQYVEFSLPNGQTLAGTVLDLDAQGARVDFNHPLADCPIEFEVEIEQIIAATEQGNPT